MSGKWSTPKRCYCKDEAGRDIGRTCPKLSGRHHGVYGYDTRIPTTAGVRPLRRFGFATQKEASAAAEKVWDLLKLADDDGTARAKIGDLVFEKSARGGELPAVEDVRRRLGLRRENLGASDTFGVAWRAWLTGKKRLRASSAKLGF